MFLTKNYKLQFYQTVYFVNGERTTHSTRKTNKQEALQYLKEFSKGVHSDKCRNKLNKIPFEVSGSTSQITVVKNNITLSKFIEEYLEYCRPVKSIKYTDSIGFSFKQLISFSRNIILTEVDIRTVDKFIYSTFKRTQRGSHLYYRTLKAAFSKAVEWS